MNRIPPIALLMILSVLRAVSPTYWETRSLRITSTRWPLGSTCRLPSMSANSLAIVVLPVPGLPVKTKWLFSWTGLPGLSLFCLFMLSMMDWISCFTSVRPVKALILAIICSSVSSSNGSPGMSASSISLPPRLNILNALSSAIFPARIPFSFVLPSRNIFLKTSPSFLSAPELISVRNFSLTSDMHIVLRSLSLNGEMWNRNSKRDSALLLALRNVPKPSSRPHRITTGIFTSTFILAKSLSSCVAPPWAFTRFWQLVTTSTPVLIAARFSSSLELNSFQSAASTVFGLRFSVILLW